MGAVISPDGRYRYRLERVLASGPGSPTAAVIMVNPSTADAEKDDATIRKLKGFGDRHGWGKIIVGNLFAYRATDVRALGKVHDPVGPGNDAYLREIIGQADFVICAWGPLSKQPPRLRDRWKAVPNIAQPLGKTLYSIGPVAKCGHPKHPLMLPYFLQLEEWNPSTCA